MLLNVQSAVGLIFLLSISWLMSSDKKSISYKGIFIGSALQILFAFLLTEVRLFNQFFLLLNKLALLIESSTREGTSFVFGYLGGADPPFIQKKDTSTFIIALQALPIVLVVSALSSLLFYWRILPAIVKGFSFLLQRTLKIGGALGLGAASNIFLGMVESPLLIKPYLSKMSKSELFTLMVCGMTTIAGTVMVLYASFLNGIISDPLAHILTASFIHVIAGITVARIIIPEKSVITDGTFNLHFQANSSIDAIVKGTEDGLRLLLNITAMLIVMVALVAMANKILSLLPWQVTLQQILGYVMSPVVWLMGIPWSEAQTAGQLMGTKTILNELIAFLDMRNLPESALSPRSKIIMTYALCSFANLGSLGIMLGGLSAIVPERRDEIVRLGVKSLIAGTIATCMSGAVIGLIKF